MVWDFVGVLVLFGFVFRDVWVYDVFFVRRRFVVETALEVLVYVMFEDVDLGECGDVVGHEVVSAAGTPERTAAGAGQHPA